jgi:octaprenyl-diphosphate synthase
MMPGQAEALITIYQPIEEQLGQVRRIFDDELDSELDFVADLCRYVSRFRGKMMRPALVLLSAEACGGITREHLTLAAVVEIVHIATLIHDDVLDEGKTRRGRPTVNTLQGNEGAVLLGDYLISHAFHLCSGLDSQYASRLIGSTTNTVCEGELLQVRHRGNYKLTEQEYFDIIARKTASLTSACCLLGAKFAGACAAGLSSFEGFGLNLGIAFQIIDDVLDISGSAGETGKTLGRDLEEGKMTLPMIHLMRNGASGDREEAVHILSNGYADRASRIRELVLRNDSMTYAIETARRYVRAAKNNLADVPESEARRALVSLADFVISRRA